MVVNYNELNFEGVLDLGDQIRVLHLGGTKVGKKIEVTPINIYTRTRFLMLL